MVGFIVKLLFTALGLWSASYFLNLISFDSLGALLLAALVLGIVNAFIRPILTLLTLPLTIVTLGLFLLVINGLMVCLMGWLLRGHGVHVPGLLDAILTAVIVGVVSWIAHVIVGDGKRRERN